MPDPTIAYSFTTATVPEWAAEVTVGVPKMIAEIARLREHRDSYMWEAADLKRDLMDVKAECCRLVCRNGDLEAERGKLRSSLGSIHAIATSGFREVDESVPRYWFERIQNIAADAVSPLEEPQ